MVTKDPSLLNQGYTGLLQDWGHPGHSTTKRKPRTPVASLPIDPQEVWDKAMDRVAKLFLAYQMTELPNGESILAMSICLLFFKDFFSCGPFFKSYYWICSSVASVYYFWLCWVCVARCGLSLVVASGGHSSLHCSGLLCCTTGALGHSGFSSCGSWALEHGLNSCGTCGSMACGIFPDQGSNLCPLHWREDSYPMYHQGSLCFCFYILCFWQRHVES